MRAALSLSILLVACASEREPSRSWHALEVLEATADASEDPPDDEPLPPPVGPCEDGEVTSCKVDLPTHGDVAHCAVGERVCFEGEWGPCEAILSDPT